MRPLATSSLFRVLPLVVCVIAVHGFEAFAESWSGDLDSEQLHAGEDEPIPGVSYLAVAGQALSDGDMATTVKALAGARSCWQVHKTKCGFVREDYDALLGVVYLEYSEYGKAARTLRAVLDKQPQRTGLGLYLGEALYQLEEYEEAARVLRKARKAGEAIPGYYVLTGRAELESGDPEGARKTLALGLERFAQDPSILLEMTLLYGRYGFFETSLQFARRHAQASGGDLTGYMLVAEGQRKARMFVRAGRVLEEARLRAPNDIEVTERLAYTYAEGELSYAAGRLFEKLATRRPTLAYAAAEQYRVAGYDRDALRLNARVPDNRRRLVQKLDILLANGSFERAVALYRPLGRARALDASIRYRLAYGAVRAGAPELAEKLLWRIQSKGTARLREVISTCREEPWLCP